MLKSLDTIIKNNHCNGPLSSNYIKQKTGISNLNYFFDGSLK